MASQRAASLPDISARETELPPGWKASAIEDVVAEETSGDWGQGVPSDDALPVKILRGTDFEYIDQGQLERAPVRYLKRASFEKRRLAQDDLLVELSGGSRDQPTGRTLLVSGDVLRSGVAFSFSNFVKRLRLDLNQVDPEFAAYFWSYLYQAGRTRTYEKRTTGIRNFKLADFLKNETIFLPPIAEQTRIVSVLRAIQESNVATEKVISAMRELKASLMRHLFTHGPVSLEEAEKVPLIDTELGPTPKHWSLVNLGDVASIKTSFPSFSQIPGLETKSESDLLVFALKVSDLNLAGNEKYIAGANIEFRISDEALARKKLLAPNALVFPKRGGAIGTNKKRLTTKASLLDPNLIGVEAGNELNFEFLYYFFEQLDLRSLSDRTPIPQLNKHNVEAVRIPLPPPEEQEEVARHLQVVDRRLEAEMHRRIALNRLVTAVLSELMNGRRRIGGMEIVNG